MPVSIEEEEARAATGESEEAMEAVSLSPPLSERNEPSRAMAYTDDMRELRRSWVSARCWGISWRIKSSAK
jgi:hypothetical protein